MAKQGSSRRWLRRQASDPYVKQAQAEGWRSRAVFKLKEIQERDRLIQPGALIVDLGAAPGGWSQYAASLLGDSGEVIAVDLLPMDPLERVTCIHADFSDESIIDTLNAAIDGRPVDLVMSDMAPNMSGNKSIDQPRSMYLAELALDLAGRVLRQGGGFVTKLFHGEGFDQYVAEVRRQFEHVKARKPSASRPRSRETYLVARNYRV